MWAWKIVRKHPHVWHYHHHGKCWKCVVTRRKAYQKYFDGCLRPIKDSTLEETALRQPNRKKNSPWAPRFGGQTRPREANVGNAAPTWPNLQSTDPGAAEYSWRFYSSAAGWWFEVGPKNTTWWVVDLPLWTIWKSIWMIIPNIWKKEMFQTTNQQSNTLAKICGGNTLPSDFHRVQRNH